MKLPEIIYYENELEDEFSKGGITPKKIDENYRVWKQTYESVYGIKLEYLCDQIDE